MDTWSLRNQRVEQDAINSYLIVIQVGAIFAVALLYFRRIVAVLMGFIGLDPVGKKLGINLLMAFVPAAVLGPLLDEWIESFLFGKVPVSVALILGAFLMLWAEKRKRRSDGYNGDAGKTGGSQYEGFPACWTPCSAWLCVQAQVVP